jgi:predicted amidohydrolase YtcJ
MIGEMKRVWPTLMCVCVVLSVLVIPGSPSYSEDDPELLLRAGLFHTVTDRGTVSGSLVVGGGRILFLGPTEEAEAMAGPRTRVIELEGRAVTPGLIDAHAHLVGLGRSMEAVDLVDTRSYREVVDRVRRAAEMRPRGQWLMGRGWDQNDWPENDFPSHDALSAAVSDHPVWLTRIDGHAALLNETAMERLGIDMSTLDPIGGRFLRDESGSPTGVLIDAAMSVVETGIPEATREQLDRWILEGGRRCVSLGLTTVTDMGVGFEDLESYEHLRASDRLPLRVALFLEDDADLLEEWFSGEPRLDREARLTVRGVKLYADGALGSRGAALVEPYSDDSGNTGLLTSSHDHMSRICRRALEAGYQVGIHAIGDRGNLVALDAIEDCLGGPRPEVRFRVEHAQVMRQQDIQRLARLGVIGSVQPTHATSDMPWAGERLGERRLEGAYAWRRMKEAGVTLAMGSDFPVEHASPLRGIHAAVTRQDLQGRPPGGWRAQERLTRKEALQGFTIDAAYSLFLEREIGSLEEGKRADLVVYSRDPMTVPVGEIPAIDVDVTIVDGDVVFEREVAE